MTKQRFCKRFWAFGLWFDRLVFLQSPTNKAEWTCGKRFFHSSGPPAELQLCISVHDISLAGSKWLSIPWKVSIFQCFCQLWVKDIDITDASHNSLLRVILLNWFIKEELEGWLTTLGKRKRKQCGKRKPLKVHQFPWHLLLNQTLGPLRRRNDGSST